MRLLLGKRPPGSRLCLAAVLATALFLIPAAAASAFPAQMVFAGEGSGKVIGAEPVPGTPEVDCHWNGAEIDEGIPGAGECTVETENLEGFQAIKIEREADSGSEFAGWKVISGQVFGGCPQESNTATECVVASFGEEIIIETTFLPCPPESEAATCPGEEFPLALKKTGTGDGTVTSEPAGINCEPACEEETAEFPKDETVTLTAAPDGESTFDAWTGCDAEPEGKCEVAMNEAREVEAEFSEIPPPDVHIIIEGEGSGAVLGIPPFFQGAPPVDCDWNGETEEQTGDCDVLATEGGGFRGISVEHEAASGSVFAGWTVEEGFVPENACEPMADTCNVLIFGPFPEVIIKAKFDLDTPDPPRLVTAAKTGSGNGWIHSAEGDGPGTINCGLPCTSKTDTFEGPVTLTAYGSQFVEWTSCPGTITDRECEVPSSEAAQEAVAEFTVNHSITVTKTGTGNGWVHSEPAGINCGLACTTKTGFFEVSTVTLTAYGAQFEGWTDCPGTIEDAPSVPAANDERACKIVSTNDETAEVEFTEPL